MSIKNYVKIHWSWFKHQDLCHTNAEKRTNLGSILSPIKCQFSRHIETSQLICTANQLTGFNMRATLALNESK